MFRRLLAVLPIALLAFQAGAPETADAPETITRDLQSMTELTREPGGERLGLLTQGLPVTILERRERWTRVRIEGWIATADLEGAATDAPPIPAQAPPTPAPAAAAPSSLSGSIFVVHEGKTIVGRSTAVRLVGDAEGTRERVAGLRGACDEKHAGLVEEAARLKKVMDSAMKQEDATAAFTKFDEAKWARREVLETLKSHDTECTRQMDEALRQSEAARALSNDTGGFVFPDVAPGDYLLVTWIDAERTRFVWEVPIALRSGERLVRDLTNVNLSHSVALPTYK